MILVMDSTFPSMPHGCFLNSLASCLTSLVKSCLYNNLKSAIQAGSSELVEDIPNPNPNHCRLRFVER